MLPNGTGEMLSLKEVIVVNAVKKKYLHLFNPSTVDKEAVWLSIMVISGNYYTTNSEIVISI